MTDIDIQRIDKIYTHYNELIEEINGENLKDIKSKSLERYKAIQFDIAQIGEHISNLPERIQQYLGKREARRIVYIRNCIIHTYDTYDIKSLEDSIYKHIPVIINQLNKLKDKNYYLK